MAKDFIVAIELGSSKITGIAGKKNPDGSINILSVVKEESSSCIRKGVVYNIDKTVQCLTNIKTKMETALKTKIAYVYVGVSGQSIRSIKNNIVRELPEETIVSQEMVDELMDSNRNMTYPEQEILNAATQEYKVDNQYQIDPVGIECAHLEGNFLNILWRKTFYRNLNKCFEKAGIPIAEMRLAPLALADCILTEAEKRMGCILVDLGADTTTVAVYHKNILRHLAVIPLGGSNITKDIASLQLEEQNAEQLKKQYGCAYTENSDIDDTNFIPIDHDRTVPSRTFIEIVESRLEEIIKNVINQVPREYDDKLLGGIILTGGGINMKNIDNAFRYHSRIDKVRLAKFVTSTIHSGQPEIIAEDGTANTVIGLLIKGEMNCAGDEITNDLFGANEQKTTNGSAEIHKPTRPINENLTTGVVLTEEEKRKQEEEEKRKKELEEEKRRQEEEERLRKEKEERRRNNIWNKSFRGVKDFVKKIVQDDADV